MCVRNFELSYGAKLRFLLDITEMEISQTSPYVDHK